MVRGIRVRHYRSFAQGQHCSLIPVGTTAVLDASSTFDFLHLGHIHGL